MLGRGQGWKGSIRDGGEEGSGRERGLVTRIRGGGEGALVKRKKGWRGGRVEREQMLRGSRS